MIELTKASITISAPVEIVFTYVSNMENYKHWFPGVIDINSYNNLAHGVVGKKYKETLLLPDGEAELIIEVDQCEDNRLFITKGNLVGVLPRMSLIFSVDHEKNCHVSLQFHSRNAELTETSDIIIALRQDLTSRAKVGLTTLKEILHTNRKLN